MSDKILKLSQAQTLYSDLRERIDALPTSEDIPEVPVQDIQIDGASVLSNGVANIPRATSSAFGVVKVSGAGIQIWNDGTIGTTPAQTAFIKAGTQQYSPIVPSHQHESAFYGLAKAAGDTTQSASDNAVGAYTAAAKAAIQNMLDVPSKQDVADIIAISTTQPTDPDTKIWIDNDSSGTVQVPTVAEMNAALAGKVSDVQIDSNSIVSNNIANIPVMSDSNMGVAKRGSGLYLTNGILNVNFGNAANIKTGTATTAIASIARGGEVVFYGLSKVAGVDLANETVTLGAYPETSKAAIRSMLGAGKVDDVQINGSSIVSNGVADIPIANFNTYGVSKMATDAVVKAGTDYKSFLTPMRTDLTVFYGLSKAAGVDLANETVTVGTYPETSKTAIRSMIGATSSNVIAVQDTQPTDIDTKIWLPETAETPVQIPTMEDLGDYVQKTDIATSNTAGLVKISDNLGVRFYSDTQYLGIQAASITDIKTGTTNLYPLSPGNAYASTFYGLAKAAGDTTQSASSNAVGTYTEEAKSSIRTMLGAGKVDDVQVNGVSVLSNGVANIPKASSAGTFGVVFTDVQYGLWIDGNGVLRQGNTSSAIIKAGTDTFRAVHPNVQHESTFYGLAKAAGVDMAASDNAIGTYTDEAKVAIRSMLGAVGTGDIATTTTPGIIRVSSNGLQIVDGDRLSLYMATPAELKTGTVNYHPVGPSIMHTATFYGLAKAAGDATQSASSNAVGNYTESAKSAISEMLNGSVAVSGTTPTIVAKSGIRYVCGEVTSLDFTPSTTEDCEIIFTSGSTVTVLTVPNTIKWPAWFNPASLAANTVYDIIITDATYGVVMAWEA